MINPLASAEFNKLKQELDTGVYVNLQDLELSPLDGIDTEIFDQLARVMRGFIFASVEAARSGHPGGSSGKVEQFLALVLGGSLAFDPLNPKHPARDRVVWSAGHCSPALYGGLALIYESLRHAGRQFLPESIHAVMPEDLVRFRRSNGPQGHIENYYPLADVATGPSGHGLSAAGGMALAHRSCGLPTKVWVFMGDAESEEGMTYEARNVLSARGVDNIIVSLDYNHFGIDGPIEEVMDGKYLNHWLGLGWNVIEVNGENILELVYAYRLAARGFGNQRPTVVLSHTRKGKSYGSKENTAASHGSPASHEEYVEIMKTLGFDVPGKEKEVMADIEAVLAGFGRQEQKYVTERLEIAKANIKPEAEALRGMKKTLAGRPLANVTDIRRPEQLPPELTFNTHDQVATRKAASAFFRWLMNESAFFYIGAGDLSKSILTNAAEEVYGLVSKDNPYGRGMRFGIAEQNMAMMCAGLTMDTLPGGFHPVSTFGTYAVFTTMMSDCVRLALIGNHLNPDNKGFFIMLAAHDGPETGEDGPTHQGLYWMSIFSAYPGMKVYKPFDAAETVEMLFYALAKGEPIALSLLRPDTPVLERSHGSAKDALQGAYVYRDYAKNKKPKRCLVIAGVRVLLNVLEVLPALEKKYNIKIVNVTSPQLFEEWRELEPRAADKVFSSADRVVAITLHNGWKGFLYPFLLPSDYKERSIGIDTYLKSGNLNEVYELAGLTAEDIEKKLLP